MGEIIPFPVYIRVRVASATTVAGGRVDREGWVPGVQVDELYLMFLIKMMHSHTCIT